MTGKQRSEVLASLNHPNIAAIYGFEENGAGSGSTATAAIVMELVEARKSR